VAYDKLNIKHYYYAAFNAPYVGHKDDELQVQNYMTYNQSYGSEFQAVRPVTENTRSPSLVLAGGTVYGLESISQMPFQLEIVTIFVVSNKGNTNLVCCTVWFSVSSAVAFT